MASVHAAAPIGCAAGAQACDRPVFLFGYPRSGTTLLSVIFAGHPDLAVPFSTTGLWFRAHTELAGGDLGTACDRLIDDERIRLWGTPLDAHDVRSRLAPAGDFGQVVKAFHSAYADAHAKPLWGNIDIATIDEMHTVNRWFPNARFVQIVRDPRDVVLSNLSIPYNVGNALDIARAWRARVGTNLRMGAMLPEERYAVLRYEDLLAAPEASLRTVCSRIGLGFDMAMLEFQAQARRQVPASKAWLWPKLQDPLAKQNAGRWRSEMGAHTRALVERETAALMAELGYDAEPGRPSRAGLLALESWYQLTAGNRGRRLRRRLRLANPETRR